MHAGEALWLLHAIISDMERRCRANPGTLAVAAQGQQACAVLAAYINIPLPAGDQAAQSQAYLEQLKAIAVAAQEANQKSKPITDANGKFGLELCDEILALLDRIETAGITSAAAYVDSVREKTSSMRESIVSRGWASEKMVSSLHNMKTGAEKWLNNHDDSPPWERS